MDLDTLLDVPDTSITYSYVLPFGSLALPAGSSLPPINEVTDFDVDDVQLRYLELREGTLTMTLFNMITSGIIGTFNLPGGSYMGSMVSLQQYVDAGTPLSPSSATVVRDLSFHQFDLTGPTYDAVNTLATELLLQLDPAGSGATVTNEDSVIAIATYGGLRPQYARGYFGQRIVHVGPEVNDFALFDPIIAGSDRPGPGDPDHDGDQRRGDRRPRDDRPFHRREHEHRRAGGPGACDHPGTDQPEPRGGSGWIIPAKCV